MKREAHSRRAFLRNLGRLGGSLAGLGLLASCAPAPPAASPARVYRVGMTAVPGSRAIIPEFWARLEQLGYVEGRNLVKVERGVSTGGLPYEDVAADFARETVDVIVAGNTPGVRAQMAANPSTPIVMMNFTGDPVANGLVESFARPGGNVTGVLGAQGEVFQKRLQLLLEAAPATSKVAVLGPISVGQEPFLQAAAESLRIPIVVERVESREGFDAAFDHAVLEGADALFVPIAIVTGVNVDRVIALAEQHRLPAIYPTSDHVARGGLMAYSERLSAIGRRAADYVDRILRGARPADLPVELPTHFDLIVNMRTARALGLTFSPLFIAQIDDVIE